MKINIYNKREVPIENYKNILNTNINKIEQYIIVSPI